MVVLAPTGIAAINAGGVTIHSFFQLPFAPYVPDTSFSADGKAQYRFRFGKDKLNIMRSIDLLVIDEISMVRADLLDAIDDVLRRFRDRSKPFGGVQLLMIGDLQQLAPVIKDEEWQMLNSYYDTPYFFSSRALRQSEYCTLELKTVYRQSDTHFLDMLNRIRENRCDKTLLDELNRRYIPNFNPSKEEGYIQLTTHNYQAQRINEHELAQLPGRSFTFRAQIDGKSVAAEFCKFLEQAETMKRDTFVDTSLKILPLLYLKAAMLPETEIIGDDAPESYVTEETYEVLRINLAGILAEKDDYLDVFIQDMVYSDQPIKKNISEDLADIYQAIKDFIFVFQLGLNETMNDSLAICQEQFKEYWGQTLVNTLRALHDVKYRQTEEDEPEEDDCDDDDCHCHGHHHHD